MNIRNIWLVFVLLIVGSVGLRAQSATVENDIWHDVWPGYVYAFAAITADYSTYYWYDLEVHGILYENGTYRGYCYANTSGYSSLRCGTFVPANPDTQYTHYGYHNVSATYYAPGPVNVPPNSQCYYSSCWWDYYGYSLISTGGYYPSYATYFAPASQISVPQQTKQFQTLQNKRTPGGGGREYFLTYKAFIPYDNVTSGNPVIIV